MKTDLRSSLLSRFAASTAVLALALVLVALLYFVVVYWSFFQGSFDATLRGYGVSMAEVIWKNPGIAERIARTHEIGIVLTSPDGQVAFGPDGNPVDPATFDSPGYRRVDAIGHDGRTASFYWDRTVLAKTHTSLLLGLIMTLLVIVVVTYAFQLSQLRPLRWLTSGVEAVTRGDFTTRVPVVRRDEIGKAAEAFNQMTRRVESMIEDRERLLADVSHELRSPLARIKVALELLPDGAKRDAIERDVREMEALTGVLLERERIRMNLDRRDADDVDLVEVAKGIAETYADRRPGVTVEFVDEPRTVRADAEMMRVMIHNLVDNAIKFSLDDSDPVRLRVRGVAAGVEIEVIDDGPGIPERDRTRVFEPFVKLDPARGHRQGYGLGLNLCQRIAVAHRGTIEIAGNPLGHGTLVRVALPFGEPAEGPAVPDARPS